MATPPRPGHLEVEAALERIRTRHERVDDPYRDQMGTEPRDVLAYLRRRAGSLSRAVAADDVWDELILSAALRWAEFERERGLLRRARSLGLSLAELGAHHGIGTRQGMQDHLDRLDALVEVGRPDVHLTREARRREKTRPAGQQWLDEHHRDVTEQLRALLTQTDRVLPPTDGHDEQPIDLDGTAPPDDTAPFDAAALADADDTELEWRPELRADVDEDVLTPATLGLLGLLLGELRTHPDVRALDRAHGLHRALRAAERLRATWEEARTRSL